MTERTLEVQRREWSRGRFLAMPLAGTIAWTVVAICGSFMSVNGASLILFIATGTIAYLGMMISKLTGEDFLDKTKPKNAFDALFFHGMAQAVLVYSIAIPFFLIEPTSLPLSVGILAGLMWVPFSWIIQHWIGYVHTGVRTALILIAWYALPEHRFVAIPLVIVGVYLFTIVVLELRWRRVTGAVAEAA